MNREQWQRVAEMLRPDWSEEQFEANWLEFQKLKQSVERGRRKQLKKLLKTK